MDLAPVSLSPWRRQEDVVVLSGQAGDVSGLTAATGEVTCPSGAGVRRVMTVLGTRPEGIKVAPVIHALDRHERLDPVVVVTGQHREMLGQVSATFGIAPDFDLDLMVPGATLTQMTATVLTAVTHLLEQVRPHAVMVQGDTTTVLASSLAAYYTRTPLIHLEAGLRTGDLWSPFPEEGNRRLTAPLASLHLAPTAGARANLLTEGVDPATVAVTGNTVIDALHWALARPVSFTDPRVQEVVRQSRAGRPVLLATTHRRESWGQPMTRTMTAVRDFAVAHPHVLVHLPMHRNPLVRNVVRPLLQDLDNVVLTDSLGYHEFAHVLAAARVVLTDSGGVQEEAPSLGKPVLVLRDTTERPEAVDAGTVRLVGTTTERVGGALRTLFGDEAAYESMATAVNPYGDGLASRRAVAAMAALLGCGTREPDFQPPRTGALVGL